VQQVVAMLPDDGVKLASQQLISAGNRDVQGTSLQLYVGDNLDAHMPLQVTLSGKPMIGTGTVINGELIVGLVVFTLALGGGGYWFLRQQPSGGRVRFAFRKTRRGAATVVKEPEQAQETQESLLDAIVALDDLYREGKLLKDAYNLRRAEIVLKLKDLRGK
jgi:hypothetical protein